MPTTRTRCSVTLDVRRVCRGGVHGRGGGGQGTGGADAHHPASAGSRPPPARERRPPTRTRGPPKPGRAAAAHDATREEQDGLGAGIRRRNRIASNRASGAVPSNCSLRTSSRAGPPRPGSNRSRFASGTCRGPAPTLPPRRPPARQPPPGREAIPSSTARSKPPARSPAERMPVPVLSWAHGSPARRTLASVKDAHAIPRRRKAPAEPRIKKQVQKTSNF